MNRSAGAGRGFTLIEALVALAVAAVVGVLAAASLRTERTQAAALTDVLSRRTALDLAAELLAEEIGFGASRQFSEVAATVEEVESEVWLDSPQLTISLDTGGPATGGGGDALTIVFVDERLSGPPVLRTLTFEAAPDSAGVWQLYRRPGSSSRQPLVEGVTALSVVALIGDGEWLGAASQVGGEPVVVSGVVILLAAGDVERPVVIELPNRPLASVVTL